jgi:hypothetical protein
MVQLGGGAGDFNTGSWLNEMLCHQRLFGKMASRKLLAQRPMTGVSQKVVMLQAVDILIAFYMRDCL